ncbi:hypothetical protein N0754_18605 [Pseudomonas aeruginosa]|nr:hypothetical protein [Pseudomonas aeruginosa]MCS9764247.1 hypothetical protein [Pseudomonas aeruginosa]MCS9820423.1 hypothetical protein [Pseudomonas aeruginosa]MCT0241004.1 hypothetical protein [Pseudomonas aeruginosa]MCT0528457.1 hypothetical protein [Pseudomonas aeruginosa]
MNKELFGLLATAAADYRAQGNEPAAAGIERALYSYRDQEPQVGREAFEQTNPPPQGVSFDETLNHYMCGASGSLHARDSYQLLWTAWQVRVAQERAYAAELKLSASDYAYDAARGHDRLLARELDELLNGEAGAAKQASLSDLVSQVASVVQAIGRPLLVPQEPVGYVDHAGLAGLSAGGYAAISVGVRTADRTVPLFAGPVRQAGEGAPIKIAVRLQHPAREPRGCSSLLNYHEPTRQQLIAAGIPLNKARHEPIVSHGMIECRTTEDGVVQYVWAETQAALLDKSILPRFVGVVSAPARQHLVECDACPTSSGCVDTCMKAPTTREPSANE